MGLTANVPSSDKVSSVIGAMSSSLHTSKLPVRRQDSAEIFSTQNVGKRKIFGLWKLIKTLYSQRTQITIEEIQTPSGASAWYAHDPRTGKSRYAETMEELVSWLESTGII